MARQIEGVYERILTCAKEEFLEKGYTEASLRTIAAKAKTSTNSIYVRFGDKEGLFEAIVAPALNRILDRFTEVQERFHSFDPERQREEVNQYSFREMEHLIDDIYENFDEFYLLLDASHGTRYEHLIDELTSIEVEYTYRYMEAVGCPGTGSREITEEFLHIVTTAYFEGVFEIVRHRMDREKARKYIQMLECYHAAGFEKFFYPD